MGLVFPDGSQIDRGGLHPARIGYLPERAFYPPRFTVCEYLTTVGRLAGLPGSRLRGTLGELLSLLELEKVSSRSRSQHRRFGARRHSSRSSAGQRAARDGSRRIHAVLPTAGGIPQSHDRRIQGLPVPGKLTPSSKIVMMTTPRATWTGSGSGPGRCCGPSPPLWRVRC
jgi:hypothetical protein